MPVEATSETHAEGLDHSRRPFELPQRIMREHLHDFVLVSEDEIRASATRDDRAHPQPDRVAPARRRWPPR